MKKIYTLVAAALICGNFNAQNLVNFESVSLTAESFDNGSAGNGNFLLGDLSLSNYYDAAWGSWNGFAISNVTDNTTAGWANQYSAFPGTGRNASANYGIFYPSGEIQALSNYIIDSFYISNTSYAGISMRDGDAYGKQFGSIYAADGTTVDGTNGEDFFKVWVIAEDFNTSKDSIEIYLADFRFPNSQDDYIVDEWIKVDLSPLGLLPTKVSFRFESSDMGTWGINTPTYFAIDDIYSSYVEGLYENQLLSIEAFPNPVMDDLTIKGESGIVHLRDINGNLILSQEHSIVSLINMKSLASGVYFLELVNSKGKAVRKIIK